MKGSAASGRRSKHEVPLQQRDRGVARCINNQNKDIRHISKTSNWIHIIHKTIKCALSIAQWRYQMTHSMNEGTAHCRGTHEEQMEGHSSKSGWYQESVLSGTDPKVSKKYHKLVSNICSDL